MAGALAFALAVGVASTRGSPGSAPAPARPTPGQAARSAPTNTQASTHPGPLSVVGLGDSVTAGSACSCAPFVDRFADLLAARDGRSAVATNLGVPGLTTGSLADQLAGPGPARSVASADTVVVTIGANDLGPLEDRWEGGGCSTSCIAPAVTTLSRGLAVDLARIRALEHPGERVEVTTYWNVFEDGDVADELRGAGFAQWSDQVTVAANRVICSTASAFGDVCVDLYTPFLSADGTRNPTGLLSSDGDHPNAAGHEVIARALLASTPP